MASMHVSRGRNALHYHEPELDLFKLLSPHVCRALTISDALDIRALRSEMLEKTLDGLLAGVFLAARDGHVVYMNATAERQVKAGALIHATRVAMTGRTASPGLFEVLVLLGRNRTLLRLTRLAAILASRQSA